MMEDSFLLRRAAGVIVLVWILGYPVAQMFLPFYVMNAPLPLMWYFIVPVLAFAAGLCLALVGSVLYEFFTWAFPRRADRVVLREKRIQQLEEEIEKLDKDISSVSVSSLHETIDRIILPPPSATHIMVKKGAGAGTSIRNTSPEP